MSRGQGAFEYVLLLSAILLIVVVAVVLLRGISPQTTEPTETDVSELEFCFNPSNSFLADQQCGFKIKCINWVEVELQDVGGITIIETWCIEEGFVRDTPEAEELKEAGLQSAIMTLSDLNG